MRLRVMNVNEASAYLQRVYRKPGKIRAREVRRVQFLAKLQLMHPGDILIAELEEEERHAHVRDDLRRAAKELGIEIEFIPYRGRDRKVIARVRSREG